MDAAARSRVRIPHIICNYVYSVYLGHLLLLEGLEVEGRGGNGHHDPKKDDHGQNGRAVGRMAVAAAQGHFARSLHSK